MKKILSFVVASAMVASMAVTAFAASEYHHTGKFSSGEYKYNSVTKVWTITPDPTGLKGGLLTHKDAELGKSSDWNKSLTITEDGIADNAPIIKTELTDEGVLSGKDWGAAFNSTLGDYLLTATNARKLAEGSASVKIALTPALAYESLADFQKDYSFSYKVKSGPVTSVALKYESDMYKFGDEASPSTTSEDVGTVLNKNYQQIVIEIKFDKILTTVASTPYEIEVNLRDKINKDNNIEDAIIKGSIINEALKPEYSDEFELSFDDGYAPVLDFDNFKNAVSEIKLTFCDDDGDEVMDVSYKAVQSGKINFTYNAYQNASIVNKYPDVEFEFINFPAAPKLAKVADISLYSENAKGGVFVVNTDGTFSNVGAKYNTSTKAYEFKSATLGSFFVASDASKIITAPVSSSASSSSSATGGKENVNTGASDIVNVAVVMSVVSLAAAGAVAFKKASK